MRGKVQFLIVSILIAGCLTLAKSLTHKTLKSKNFLKTAHSSCKHHELSKAITPIASGKAYKTKKTASKAEKATVRDNYLELNTKMLAKSDANSTDNTTNTETLVVSVTETVYDTTVEYSGPSVVDYASAANTEILKIKGTIEEAAEAIPNATETDLIYLEESINASFDEYETAANNATEELIEVVEAEAEAVIEEIDGIKENTAKSYNNLDEQLDKNLNQTLAVEKILAKDAIDSDDRVLGTLLEETTELAYEAAAAAAASTNSSCSSATNCSTCVQDSSCGWCILESSCVDGDSVGPTNQVCTFYEYGICSTTSSHQAPMVLPASSGTSEFSKTEAELNAALKIEDEVVANLAESEEELIRIEEEMATLAAEVTAIEAACTTNVSNSTTNVSNSTTNVSNSTTNSTSSAAETDTTEETGAGSSEVTETATETTVETNTSTLIQYNFKSYPATQKALLRSREGKILSSRTEKRKQQSSETH